MENIWENKGQNKWKIYEKIKDKINGKCCFVIATKQHRYDQGFEFVGYYSDFN